jgi:hypothetical protein
LGWVSNSATGPLVCGGEVAALVERHHKALLGPVGCILAALAVSSTVDSTGCLEANSSCSRLVQSTELPVQVSDHFSLFPNFRRAGVVQDTQRRVLTPPSPGKTRCYATSSGLGRAYSIGGPCLSAWLGPGQCSHLAGKRSTLCSPLGKINLAGL